MSDEQVKCILCGDPCLEIHVISDDVVEGYKDRKTTLKAHVDVNADLVCGWKERLVCRQCWTKRKPEVITKLWDNAQSTIKYRLPSFTQQVQQKRKELKIAERNLVQLKALIKAKNPGLKNCENRGHK
jgi:hypothetical protein